MEKGEEKGKRKGKGKTESKTGKGENCIKNWDLYLPNLFNFQDHKMKIDYEAMAKEHSISLFSNLFQF